jgi:hypothetical protein
MFTGAIRAAKLLFVSIATLIVLLPLDAALAASYDIKNSAPPFIEHDLTANAGTSNSNSWCALCGYGYVRIVVGSPCSGDTLAQRTPTRPHSLKAGFFHAMAAALRAGQTVAAGG